MEPYGEKHMSRKTRLSRARLAAGANYWRNHIAMRKGRAGPCKAAIPAVPCPAKPTDHKPGTAA